MNKVRYKILLVGNPNSGKTTIFNSLAGLHAKVANYPGVTVSKKEGMFSVGNTEVEIEDLPGVYTLSASSAEEKITRDAILENSYDLIVNVVDSSNFERNLYLTMQIAEMRVPMIVVLNMTDELRKRGKTVDAAMLSNAIGVPVTKCVGYDAESAKKLRNFIVSNLDVCTLAHFHWDWLENNILSKKIELARDLLKANLPEEFADCSEWMAIRALENDEYVLSSIKSKAPLLYDAICGIAQSLETETGDNSETLVSAARYGIIDRICLPALKTVESPQYGRTRLIDSILLNKLLGIPIFLLLMFGIFEFVFELGDPLMGIMESLFGHIENLAAKYWPGEGAIKEFFIGGVINGVGTILVFLPNIILLFLALSILEDSGYMARAAFLCDRIMKRFGLSGSSIIPMLVGFGCSVPAIMGTRALKNPAERLTATMVIPLFSCGARFPVYVLLIPAFFPPNLRGAAMFCIYLAGISLAFICARILRSTTFRGNDSTFLIELPPYRLPRMKNISREVGFRTFGFLQKAGTLILGMSLILWLLSTYPKNTAAEVELTQKIEAVKSDTKMPLDMREHAISELESALVSSKFDHTFMGRISQFATPIFKPLGFDNKIVSSLIGALAAKEVFIAQLGMVYGNDNAEDDSSLRDKIAADYTPIQGASILLFILISAPCIATISTTYSETGSIKFALAQFFGLTALGYCICFIFYQCATFF